MGRLQPPGFRDLKMGDRLVLIHPDNTRRIVEVTRVGQGTASGRFVGPEGPEGRVQKISAGTILCREGQAEIRCAGNLVAGDLVYTPSHKSGLQYGKIVSNGNAGLGLLRWDESNEDWLKRPQEIPWDTQWFAHESEPAAPDRFFERIKEDRRRWKASSGRSGFQRIEGSDVEWWRTKERRWDLSRSDPTYFRPPSKWESGEYLSDPKDVLTIGVHVTGHEDGCTIAQMTNTPVKSEASFEERHAERRGDESADNEEPLSEVKKPSIWLRLWTALTK